eukprot:1689723-Prymnesium_polylepis.1
MLVVGALRGRRRRDAEGGSVGQRRVRRARFPPIPESHSTARARAAARARPHAQSNAPGWCRSVSGRAS